MDYIILYANTLCNVLSTILYDLYYSLYAPNMNKHWRRNREGGPDNLPSKLINIHTCSADRCDLSVYNVQPPPPKMELLPTPMTNHKVFIIMTATLLNLPVQWE